MKIGATLYLSWKNATEEEETKLKSKIIDKDEHYLYIDYPINEITSKTEFIPIDTYLAGFYTDHEKVPLHFPTQVIKKVNLIVPALALQIPKPEEIKRIQRREYVRVPTAVDIAVHGLSDDLIPFTTVTTDISGGGLAIVLPKNIFLEKGLTLNLWIVLPMSSSETEFININGEIIREVKQEASFRFASIRFTSITHQDRQKIIRFCFEKQREQRVKELNM